MGIVRFHGKALRLNGLTDGLVVPTGKFREAGFDLRPKEFSASIKSTKSHATKTGRMHIESPSNPLNAIRGAFTIDAYVIPDYGGVIVEKPGSFRLKYGEPFSNGKMIFEVHTADRPYTLSTAFDVSVKTSSNSGVYSSSSNAHRPQDITTGQQGLVLVTAQYTQDELKCYINGDLVADLNLGGEGKLLQQSSSDIFIGGRGGEFRGIIESIRINQSIDTPSIEPLVKTENTFGLWQFDDEYDVPEVYFFDNARPGATHQGRDGPTTHDGLLDVPMVGIGYDFNTTHFKIRDYSANPGGPTDRYTALEKLAALTQGIPLEEVKDQTWYSSTLDLTDQDYFTGVSSTVLNAVINHAGTSPTTGIITPPDSQNVRFAGNVVLATSSSSTLNPSVNRVERIRITGLDFANNRVNCTSVHLANDAANGTIDNLPTTQGHIFSHTDNTPVYFTLGKADLLIDPGNEETHNSVSNQRTRKKDTFTLAQYTQSQRFSDASGFSNDAYFFSTKSRSTALTDANTLYDPSDTYPGMGAVTSYSLVEGDFYLKMLPSPDEQTVKQTVQGIANTFTYTNENVAIHSLVSENERVRVTEPTYHGEISNIINKATTVSATDSGSSSSNVFNRIIVEHGIGFYDKSISQNVYASTRDEIVAIAVSNIKPFMLKGLDIGHTAEFSNGVPTNDNYIRHLTPEKESRVAVIDSPAALVSAGGPNQILVHYNAIDLTGEVVAGTSLASGEVSTKLQPDHATGNAAYLVVSKTVPCGSAVFGSRTVSDWLRRPYSGNQTDGDAILLTVTSPGGLVNLPTTNFNDKPASHTLTSNPTGDITPSPFINIEETVYGLGTGIKGYGPPQPIASTNTPDDSSNSDFHLMYISTPPGTSRKSHTSTKLTPPSLRRSNFTVMDVIDNELTGNSNFVLAHPSNRVKCCTLDDVADASTSPLESSTATLEKTLMRGRIEEITPQMGEGEGESMVTIRGRSILMDVIDHRSSRDFNIGQGSPVKEIGDLGTPTVTMTLGGLGQGGVDIQPTYAEHPFLPGWKDKIVGAGNASVRNDKQTSTYYASTRAVTEIPLFPSMFFDVDALAAADNDARTPLPSDKRFKMTVDCTMATNRPEMRENESRFAVDWGQVSPVASFEVTDQLYSWAYGEGRWVMRCQRPSVQAVITGTSSNTLTVDDVTPFLSATGERGLAANASDTNFYVTIGEGVLNDGYGIMIKVNSINSGNNQLLVDGVEFNPQDTSSNTASHTNQVADIDAGMTVTLGGYIILDSAPTVALDTHDFIISIHDETSSKTNLTTPVVASTIADAVKTLMGLNSSAVHVDPNNSSRYLILDGPNMEAFEWDILENHESANDRQSLHPIVCQTNYLALKGKKSDGTALEYVRPLEIDFSDVANTMGEFNLCVDEVVRRINMAGHPQAKNSAGGSAFDPPPLFPSVAGNKDTGTHMGYVRAFIGTSTESRDGEAGVSIVIHSTVPGASGRNFNVRLSNQTPYTYKPVQVVGYGGLLASNSRLYQPNLIPSPMPIGADGETFVPISTFRGAPSGSALDSANSIRSYNGLGGSIKVTTVASPVGNDVNGTLQVESTGVLSTNSANLTGASQTIPVDTVDATTKFRVGDKLYDNEHRDLGTISAVTATSITVFGLPTPVIYQDDENFRRDTQMTSPTLADFTTQTAFTHIAVSTSTEDYLKRITQYMGPNKKGILRVGSIVADFDTIDQQRTATSTAIMTNCFLIRNVVPRGETMSEFIQTFYDTDGAAIDGVEIELIYPGTDAEGIVYFGGGHTGVTFDISDGTANDYSDDFLHHYSKGPTGFSGFQNLHEVSTASAVLDFTDITNNDTINDNTLRGIHHKLTEGTDGALGRALFYARLNESSVVVPTTTVGTPWHLNDSYFIEDLYGSKLRLVRGFIGELANALSGTWSSMYIKAQESTLASDMASGDTSITLVDASRFYVGTVSTLSQNSIMIDGTHCKYSGKNGNTLTGVTLANGNAINFTATAGDSVTGNNAVRNVVEPNTYTGSPFGGYVLLDNGNAEAFTYTGGMVTTNLGYWQINNVAGGGSGTASIGNKVMFRRKAAISTTQSNGPAVSVDSSDKGTSFGGQTAIIAHDFDQDTATHNVEYGPMKDLDVTKDHTISVWFKPTDTSFASDAEVASGPLISGVDNGGKFWGLYISGKRNNTTYQYFRPSYIYYDGSNYKLATVNITVGGLQVQKGTWTNLIVKVTDGVVDFRAGNTTHIRFKHYPNGGGTARTHDETGMVSLTGGSNLPSNASGYPNNVRSLSSETVTLVKAQLPPDLSDGVPKTNSLFIGLSTIRRSILKDVWSNLTGNSSGAVDLVVGTNDGVTNTDDATTNSNTIANNVWLFKTALCNVSIFNYALPDSECDKIFAARGVW